LRLLLTVRVFELARRGAAPEAELEPAAAQLVHNAISSLSRTMVERHRAHHGLTAGPRALGSRRKEHVGEGAMQARPVVLG